MRVFVSWSGKRSKALAQALVDWLPRVLPLVEPWMSEEIPPGSEWRPKLIAEVKRAAATIVCVTPENLRSPWPNFEAGAATAGAAERLFPVLLTSDALSGPLEGLQVTSCSEDGIWHLVRMLNLICERQLADTWLATQFNWLWKDLDKALDEAKRVVPDSSWEDYDDAIKNIREHLKELERTKKVNVITFYVRDYATPKEAIDFYIEANIGLHDPAPMFGPIVFDDFRKKEFVHPEGFTENMKAQLKMASKEKIEHRATTFVGREKILGSATFRHLDSDGDVKALLNLNWRNKQTFPEERREQLREVAQAVFKLLPSKPSISLKRSRLMTRELRSRRYLGAAEQDGTSPGDQWARIRGALAQFFAPTEKDIDIEFISLVQKPAVKWSRDGNAGTPCKIEADWQWVQATTKPLFLKSANQGSTIIVPMRIPPGLDTCASVIVITELANGLNTLESDMVRPLCSLGDTFGGMLRPRK